MLVSESSMPHSIAIGAVRRRRAVGDQCNGSGGLDAGAADLAAFFIQASMAFASWSRALPTPAAPLLQTCTYYQRSFE